MVRAIQALERVLRSVGLPAKLFLLLLPILPLVTWTSGYALRGMWKELHRMAPATAASPSGPSSDLVWFGVLLGVALVGTTGGFVLILRGVRNPLRQMIRFLGSGDLTHRLVLQGSDELTDLATAFNANQNALSATVKSLRKEAAELASCVSALRAGTAEMNLATSAVAKGSETQRSASEHVSAAIHQWTASIEQVARNVEDATQRAGRGRVFAEEGAAYGEDTERAMRAIQEATARIVGAIRVIQDIARQTNLLSLNAAIEAAKAGTQGKGFAVVAEEIRKLAERSATAAKEIEALIATTNLTVGQGAEKSKGSATSLSKIRSEVEALSAQIEEIGEAAREQAAMAVEIQHQTESMRISAEQNAAGATELAATVEASGCTMDILARTSDAVAAEVATFKLEEQGTLDRAGAISAHQAWKARLQKVVEGTSQEQLDPAVVCRDDRCALGKWIHGPGQACCGQRPDFPVLKGRHGEFHRIAGRVIEEAKAGRNAKASALLEGEFTEVSRDVIAILSRIEL